MMDYFWIGSNLSRALSGFQYSGFDLRNAQVIENARLDPVEGKGGEVIQFFPQAKISVRGYLVHSVDRSEMRSGFDCLGASLDNFLDCQNRIGKSIELFLPIAFGRFDHKSENFREGNRRRMKAKVQKKFADLGDGFGFRNTGFFQSIEIFIGESQDKLVHSGGLAFAGRQSWEAFAELGKQISGGQHGRGSHSGNAFLAKPQKV